MSENTQAKVAVFVGYQNRQIFSELPAAKPDQFCEGHFTSRGVSKKYWLELDSEGEIRRIIICVHHLEAYFHGGSATPVLMDAQCNLIGALLNMKLDLDYFQRRTSHAPAEKPQNMLDIVFSQLRADAAYDANTPPWTDWEAIPAPVRNWLAIQGYETEASFESFRYQGKFEGISVMMAREACGYLLRDPYPMYPREGGGYSPRAYLQIGGMRSQEKAVRSRDECA